MFNKTPRLFLSTFLAFALGLGFSFGFMLPIAIGVSPARADEAPAPDRPSDKSPEKLEEAVQATLMTRHPTDTREWWRALGEGVTPRLVEKMIEIYGRDGNTYHRMRLIEALGWFPESAAAAEFVKQQAQATPDDVIRNAAIKTVGISQGAKEEEFLAKYLLHADPHTREAAAEALRRSGTPRAKERVEAFLREEKTPWLVAKLKGLPIPIEGGATMTSSEDRLSPDFSGNWSGYWVGPQGEGTALKTQAVGLKLQAEGLAGLQGQLSLKLKGAPPRLFPISQASGKGLKWSGKWLEQAAGQSQAVAIEGELQSRGAAYFLLVRIPSRSAILYLKRD